MNVLDQSLSTLTERPEGVPIRSWLQGVPVPEPAWWQLERVAGLPVVFKQVVGLPNLQEGRGSPGGSVVATFRAVIPAAIGTDIGCGLIACKTSLLASDLPGDLTPWRQAIERAVPHGHSIGLRGPGLWGDVVPILVEQIWTSTLAEPYRALCRLYPALARAPGLRQLGTLGSGNHFIELHLDPRGAVWVLVHAGSRGPGKAIGRLFTELARRSMRRRDQLLPDRNLAYLEEGSRHFEPFLKAVKWARHYAQLNRELVLEQVLAMLRCIAPRPFSSHLDVVTIRHNDLTEERHFGHWVRVARKGAQRLGPGDRGIVAGAIGSPSYIVRGLGSPASFESCASGCGRVLSRQEARLQLDPDRHLAALSGIACRRDSALLAESPLAYRPIGAVMAAQADLIEVEHTLRPVLSVKG
jgi:tRNA-splicing ligase RtcB